MSSAHVAGVAALMIASGVLGAHPTPSQVLARLEATAQPLGSSIPNPDYGYGLVDAAAATAPQARDSGQPDDGDDHPGQHEHHDGHLRPEPVAGHGSTLARSSGAADGLHPHPDRELKRHTSGQHQHGAGSVLNLALGQGGEHHLAVPGLRP